MADFVANFELEQNNYDADFELENVQFDALFEINPTGAAWGTITGRIGEQTDLINLLNEKVDIADFNDLSTTVTNNYNELSGDITDLTATVTDNYNTLSGQISDLTGVVNNNYTSLDNRLTTAEGSILDLTDTVNDNYTELDGKITTTNNNLSTLSQTVEDNNTAINNRVDGIVDSFDGDISDLNDAIDNLSDTVSDNYTDLNGKITDNTDDITTILNSINSYGDIVTYDAAYFATASQGALADTSLQPNDNITLLNNNAGYITISALDGYATEDYVNNQGYITADALNGYATEQWVNNKGYITGIDNSDVVTALGYTPYNASNPAGYITAASLPTVNNNTITIQKNGVNVDSFTLNQNSNKSINITVPTNNNELTNGAGYITSADIPTLADLTTTAQLAAINSGATSTNIGQIATNTQDIADEVTNRQNADNGLQSQIDAIVSSSDVFDIVGTYAELQAYDISTVPVNDIIKVLVDSTHSNAATYYRCVENGGVKTWSYIGSEGAYYTKSEADGRFVAQTITVNGQPLSSNVTLTASDVGALPDSTVIPTVNNSTITIQKNGVAVDTFTLNQASAKTINISVPTDTSDLTNGAGYITGITSGDVTTALGYTPYNSSNPNGYISGITSSDVTTALGYTPYNSTNPSGYITSSALTNYVTTDTTQSISGQKTFTDIIKSSVNNSLTLTQSNGEAFGVTVKRTDANNEIKFGIGQGGDNRGIWDVRHNKWAFNISNNGKAYALGNEIAITSAIPTQASDISAADNTLSNVSSIDSNSAVQTALDGKVSKSGDTMTGDLTINKDTGKYIIKSSFDSTTTTAPSEFINLGILAIYDTNDNYTGYVQNSFDTGNNVGTSISARRIINGVNKTASLGLSVDSSGNASCKFPNTTCVDGQYTETNETIVSSLNLNNANSSDTGWYTLSSLPDNGEYLCWIIGRGTTGSTSGNYIYCRVVSDIVTDYMTCCATRTRTASSVTSEGVICIPVRNKRVKIKRDANWNGTGLFILKGYRRIGTNA